MRVEYKNIYLNLNSKLYSVDKAKYNLRIRSLKESIANSEGYVQELLTYKFEVLQYQYEELCKCNDLSGNDFKKHRRLIIGNLLDDRFHELISQDVIDTRHPNMYKIDLTSNLPLVLAYTFNLNYTETYQKIKMLCDSQSISVEYLSCCILSQARNEILRCDIELGMLWSFFPEIKRYLSELCKISNETEKCLIDCVSNIPFNQTLGIPVDDEEIQLLTALSLKLVLSGQEMICDAIVQIDELKKTENSYPRIYSQYICGCIFGVHGFTPESFVVTNPDGTDYYLPVEKF